MKATEYFRRVEEKIPLGLSLAGDPAGFFGPGDPDAIEVGKVLLMMDYLPVTSGIDYAAYDLLVLHHPPLLPPPIPSYVIHTGWDRMRGGACDALAGCLDIVPGPVLDRKTGLGIIGFIRNGPVPLHRFARNVMVRLGADALRLVNGRIGRMVSQVALVPGFGLNPAMIRTAGEGGIDLLLSGDLTHPGAILARHLGIALIDAPHHATELPGLIRLADVLSSLGLPVDTINTGVPWKTLARNGEF